MADDFFEGSEKLLEVWFPVHNEEEADLRKIKRKTFEKILEKVECQVLNVIEDSTQIAFLLSESSMFVTKEKIILKTCGTTTLLLAIDDLLACANRVGFAGEQSLVFYSRRKFSKPGLQKSPHRCFSDEASVLMRHYQDGVYHAFGPLNQDCWYLFLSTTDIEVKTPDQTIEMIMTELDPTAMAPYFKISEDYSARDATEAAGIDQIFDGTSPKIDDYLFEPCGYSMNGLLGDERYYTIHITPQDGFSYASFESNVFVDDYTELIKQVLAMFRPKKALITLFANEGSPAKEGVNGLSEKRRIADYRRLDFARSQFGNYEFVFVRLSKETK